MSRMLGRLRVEARVEAQVEQPPARSRRDWALAAVVVGSSLVELAVRDDVAWPLAALGLGVTLALAMLWRRTRPLAMVTLGFGAFAAVDLAAVAASAGTVFLYSGASVVVLLYALFRWGSARQAAAGSFVALGEWGVSVATDTTGPADAVGGLVVLALAAAVGATVRFRRVAEVERLERVRSGEREALARELHDTVAHHVSGIAVQAQAGRCLAAARDLDGADGALEVIEAEASRTLAEMRTMVGSLRRAAGAGEALAPPGVDDLDRLTTADGAAGPAVDVERHGDLDGLPPSLQAALFRVAQESVTNARRHARAATRVLVTVSGEPDVVHLSVSDDGQPVPGPARPSGYGLTGMAERVTLLGGTLAAGPRPGNGWAVQATIPRRGGGR